jgi:hypothetical protein
MRNELSTTEDAKDSEVQTCVSLVLSSVSTVSSVVEIVT